MRDRLAWPEVAREPVADCRVFAVERTIAESPLDGSRHAFYRIHSRDWAQIVPVTAEGQIVLVRQYRHGAQRVTLEMPAGMVDEGEDPAAAALRECLEETGYRARAAVPLGSVNPNPTLFDNRLHSYFAIGVTPERAIANTATETTEVVLLERGQLKAKLESGEIDHALVALTLWRFLADPRTREI
jgi:8-oxo-dGTP pyrophosphatase MutT (NUDIX family)